MSERQYSFGQKVVIVIGFTCEFLVNASVRLALCAVVLGVLFWGLMETAIYFDFRFGPVPECNGLPGRASDC